MGAVIPAAPPREPGTFIVGDQVEVRIVKVSRLVPGTYSVGDTIERQWRPGVVAKVARKRLTVDCPAHENRPPTSYASIPSIFVRLRQAAPSEVRE